MNNIKEFIQLAENIVNELGDKIIADEIGLYEAEKNILDFINSLGNKLLENVLKKIPEPTIENTLELKNGIARYRDTRPISLKNRFGGTTTINRRSYKIIGGGSYHPLDKKLGILNCKGFTPLPTFLLALFGGTEPYESSATKISECLGFPISGTAVHSNTENIGEIIYHDPIKNIPSSHQNEESELMIVEIDGTMSPQIKEVEGIKGQDVKKQPTEYKECNVITIEKHYNKGDKMRWYGAHYGKRDTFCEYVRKTGLKIGQLKAAEIVFIADGAKHNWEIQINNFPDAIPILDFYHACEHLADFCSFLPQNKSEKQYKKWKKMIYEGEIVQVMEEMKLELYINISNNDEALKHLNYFNNNKNRMDYLLYKKKGYPIGSGMVEGACKFVVGKRFKNSGMRWKKADNESVLDVRLAVINDTLHTLFEKKAA